MKTLELTDCESRLLNQLLESERQALQSEVHHTDTAALKTKLQERFAKVTRLIERLGENQAVASCGCKSN